jgi:hypothetical protein
MGFSNLEDRTATCFGALASLILTVGKSVAYSLLCRPQQEEQQYR